MTESPKNLLRTNSKYQKVTFHSYSIIKMTNLWKWKTQSHGQGSESGVGWERELRRDVSLAVKEQHEMILVLMELFCIWTVNTWLRYYTIVLQDVTIRETG